MKIVIDIDKELYDNCCRIVDQFSWHINCIETCIAEGIIIPDKHVILCNMSEVHYDTSDT